MRYTHSIYSFLILYLHIQNPIYRIWKEKLNMFFKSMIRMLTSTFNDNGFDKVDPSVVKYFRTEYGQDWKVALQHHLYKESVKNNKKAA